MARTSHARSALAALAVLTVALTGCPLGTSTTTTATLTGGAGATVAAGAPSSSSVGTTEATEPDREQVIHGAIVRRQLETLHGMTPDQAKQLLQKLGHDGQVNIGEVTDSGGGHTYIKACGQNKVCYTSGESGIGLHDDITLFINPTLKIAAPPP